MQALTPDDLLPLDEFAARRLEFVESHRRYCDLYRRVRVGPDAVLNFENRQTIWFRIQELLRVARVSEPEWIRRELAVMNRLLPRSHRLQAALLLAQAQTWRDFSGGNVMLAIESTTIPATLVTVRPEDRVAGFAHWVEFEFTRAQRKAFADFSTTATIKIHLGEYQHSSGELTHEVRQSLLDDLSMSDRDAA